MGLDLMLCEMGADVGWNHSGTLHGAAAAMAKSSSSLFLGLGLMIYLYWKLLNALEIKGKARKTIGKD
jgi:hypothetical protein